jgi:serine/threonine protein kinase
MATGKMPFPGDSLGEICSGILRDEQTPPSQLNPQISPGLEAVIQKALKKDYNLRYQHASDMRADLQRLKRDIDTTGIATVNLSPLRAAESGSRFGLRLGSRITSAWKPLAAAILVLIGLVAGGLYLRSRVAAHSAKEVPLTDSVLLADFVNKTGDPVFDDALKQALTIELS